MKKQYHCPNCGALIKGKECEFCGTVFTDDNEPEITEDASVKEDVKDSRDIIKSDVTEDKNVKYRKDGLPKVPLSIFEKIVITISVLLVIATILCGIVRYGFVKLEGVKDVITASFTNPDEEKEPFKMDKRIAALGNYLMPETITLENGDGVKFDVKLEINADYDAADNENILGYLNMFTVYDWEGNKIENEDTIQIYNITGSQLKIMAVMKVGEKLLKVKSTVNNVFIFLCMFDVVAAVFIAYFIWKRADDRRELREAAIRESEIRRVTSGMTEEELKNKKKKKKKKR